MVLKTYNMIEQLKELLTKFVELDNKGKLLKARIRNLELFGVKYPYQKNHETVSITIEISKEKYQGVKLIKEVNKDNSKAEELLL